MYDSILGWRIRPASGVLVESLSEPFSLMPSGCAGLRYESRHLQTLPEPGETA
jgi:hypothetical protein